MNKAGTRSAIDSVVTSKDSFIIFVLDFLEMFGPGRVGVPTSAAGHTSAAGNEGFKSTSETSPGPSHHHCQEGQSQLCPFRMIALRIFGNH